MKILSVFFIFILLSMIDSSKALAFSSSTDRQITGIMHVFPQDMIAGNPSTFSFDFTDQTERFTLSRCICTFQVLENGHSIASQPLYPKNKTSLLTSSDALYIFPHTGSYQILVLGKPQKTHAFTSFALFWNIQITKTILGKSTSSFREAPQWGFTGIGLLLLAGYATIRSHSRREQSPKEYTPKKK